MFWRLSWYGLIAGLAFLSILMPASLVSPWDAYRVHIGLRVHLRPGIETVTLPWIQPVRVQMEAAGSDMRPILRVNSQPVSWEDLGAVLRQELSRRPPKWPVYLIGDRNLSWEDVVRAIDTIRGMQAEVVLVTDRAKITP